MEKKCLHFMFFALLNCLSVSITSAQVHFSQVFAIIFVLARLLLLHTLRQVADFGLDIIVDESH